MSPLGLPPPPAESCLDKPYMSSQKGGTLIAEDVVDLQSHQARLCDPDGYRPKGCPGESDAPAVNSGRIPRGQCCCLVGICRDRQLGRRNFEEGYNILGRIPAS
jgi:hypothetical protein